MGSLEKVLRESTINGVRCAYSREHEYHNILHLQQRRLELSETSKLLMARDLASGLAYVHQLGCLHRDVAVGRVSCVVCLCAAAAVAFCCVCVCLYCDMLWKFVCLWVSGAGVFCPRVLSYG